MQAKTLLYRIESHQSPVIIDVRSQKEYASGHIPGALHVSFWAAYSPAALNDIDDDELLVLYCQHGPRAGIAKLALAMSGFNNIRYLDGHMHGWQKANLPLQTTITTE